MLIGNKHTFAIECYNESKPITNGQVFGRMCVWIRSAEYGDITEPACMLDVTEAHLKVFVENAENIESIELEAKDGRELYDFLDSKIYLNDGSTDEQICKDLEEYSRYEFLACGGESFDFGNSFVVREANEFRFVFVDKAGLFHSYKVSFKSTMDVIDAFIEWMEVEKMANKHMQPKTAARFSVG